MARPRWTLRLVKEDGPTTFADVKDEPRPTRKQAEADARTAVRNGWDWGYVIRHHPVHPTASEIVYVKYAGEGR